MTPEVLRPRRPLLRAVALCVGAFIGAALTSASCPAHLTAQPEPVTCAPPAPMAGSILVIGNGGTSISTLGTHDGTATMTLAGEAWTLTQDTPGGP